MIYSVNFMDMAGKINPHAAVKYLKDTGWTPYKTKKEDIRVFQRITKNEEFHQVTIPIDKNLADYKKLCLMLLKANQSDPPGQKPEIHIFLSFKCYSDPTETEVLPHPAYHPQDSPP